MNMRQEHMEELIDSIYEAATDARLWPDLVAAIARHTGGYAGGLVLWDTAGGKFPISHDFGYPDDTFAIYRERYVTWDPRSHALLRNPHLEIYTDEKLGLTNIKRRHDYYDWERKNPKMYAGYGMRIFTGHGFEALLALGRTKQQGEASSQNIHHLRLLLPHLRRSIALSRKIGERVSIAALDVLSFGVALIDERGEVSFANKAMSRISEDADGIKLTRAGLVLAHPDEDAAFQRLIEGLREKLFFQKNLSRTALSASRPSGRRAYSILMCPTPVLDSIFPGLGRSIMICVSDPAQTMHMREGILTALFGLSPAEAQLAIALVKGGSLTLAARERGLTEGSARQYMKRIFSKTNTSSQVELVALIMGSLRP